MRKSLIPRVLVISSVFSINLCTVKDRRVDEFEKENC